MIGVTFVTDPLCSWCWGMAPEIEDTRLRLGDSVACDLAVGGINVDSTHPITDYAKGRLQSLWQNVTATTGQQFGHVFPEDDFVYNSTAACVAIHAARRLLDAPPFEFLHGLQQAFFMEGRDIGRREVLIDVAERHAIPAAPFESLLDEADLHDAAHREFKSSRRYGTNALPSVLVDEGAGPRLLAGGYVSAEMLVELIEALPDRG